MVLALSLRAMGNFLGITFLPGRIIKWAQAVKLPRFLSINLQRERPEHARALPCEGGCSVGASGFWNPVWPLSLEDPPKSGR